MNKYQEALEFLRSEDVTAWGNDKLEILYFHLDNIEELVEKATPKKPIIRRGYSIEYYHCPNCNAFIAYCDDEDDYHDYCVFCGQAIDWSDGSDEE